MKKYAQNSPESMARLLVMLLMADGNMDPDEIDALDKLHIYEALNIPRPQFIAVLHQYCNDLSDEADEDGRIRLIDRQRIDDLLDTVVDPGKRLLVAALSLDMIKSHGSMTEAELAIYTHMLDRWHLTLEDIEDEFAR
ncbi:TerB family tellurite resistance protein [Burkholderiaceae bacterium DAT-1]|nr:TerB family tellurite resistance protein [Burkholderiaceae bacterium DAT-1]